MLFSYQLLNRFVDLSKYTLKEVIDRLTFSGFEVEDHHPLASATNLVIGQVLSCEPVTGSDHLHSLKVDCGDEGILSIVCGAKNVRTGLKVIVALPGCELKALNTIIKKGVIHGLESNGMCCSLVELGLDKGLLSEKEINGIHELPDDAPVGLKDVLSYLSLNDYVLDVNVLPNRPDCLSYIGLARELASLFSLKFNPLPHFDMSSYPSCFQVISHTDRCPRIDFLGVKDLVPKKETPDYIKAALIASGIRSISPIVDLGNYSMLLTGQPLNMYDASLNPSMTYQVRDDYTGKFITFDKKEVELKPGDLVIYDDKKPVCLAGILAGENESITDSTEAIAIEAACFYHANIRRTALRLGLSSFSQQLFSKSRNPLMIDEALQVTISLLPVFFEKYTIFGYTSFSSLKPQEIKIPFSLEKMNHRLGSHYTQEQVDEVLNNYRIKKDGDFLIPPIDRVDLKEQCDIEEEVFRYFPATFIEPNFAHFPITAGALNAEQKEQRRIREFLVARGLSEILSFTLIDEKMDKFLRVFDNKESYKLLNPMTKYHEIVRSDLLSSMFATIDFNLSHQQDDLALFEISSIDTPTGNHIYLAIGLTGHDYLSDRYQAHNYDFFDLKGLICAILDLLGISSSRYRLAYSQNPSFHPYNSADIYVGKDLVGTFGKLHPEISKKDIYLAEIDLSYLLALKGNKTKFKPYSNYPVVKRDLSLSLGEGTSYSDLLNTIKKANIKHLKDVKLFDIFKDEKTEETYLGISLFLGKEEGTLTDDEITADVETIISTLRAKLGIKLRGE